MFIKHFTDPVLSMLTQSNVTSNSNGDIQKKKKKLCTYNRAFPFLKVWGISFFWIVTQPWYTIGHLRPEPI